ncbi:hypothetical protein SAMN05216232_1991 [Virgibacillus subterraneus]|uniref:Phage protein n=1 Tax=Virgibacillus subterraneus TaxID=621109 RepID=A0A1H9ED61_9BACI|nr:hypothetical protein [Virgibacillus subterraneus]SEQ23696.1 hypothetical protein SAMN05216232_1991 [Virgibacillus subterraneus]
MKYILCQPAIKRFEWELEICITRLQKLGIKDIVLLFTQQDDKVPKYLQENYDVETHVYIDNRTDKIYIPSVKPYLWMKYLEEDQSRENDTYFYLDSDVLLREIPGVKPTENKWYASACESYLSVDYIDSKGSDLLERMCDAIGINDSLIREENPIGGAQWVIKNPSYDYWKKVYEDSVKLYKYLNSVEGEYVQKNDTNYTPIQKWTAEMWAQLWNVYHFGKTVKTSTELDFCWPTDPVDKYHEMKIYHNAGVVDDNQNLFFKGKYVSKTPFRDSFEHIDKSKASIEYVKAIKEVLQLAKFEVIAGFRDKETDKEYFVGDKFPKPANKKVKKERIDELMSSDNNAGTPLIKEQE